MWTGSHLDTVRDAFHGGDADGTLFARLQQTANQLLTLESLAASVLFHDHVRNFVDPLVAGEAFAAPEALAPAPNDFALAAFPRVDHFVAEMRAVRALHGASPCAAALASFCIPPSLIPS